jgi:hypothetical protein
LESWLDYFHDLWSEQSETIRKKGSSNGYTEPTVEEELDNVLRKLKPNKAPGEDGLNLDLFKYAWKLFDKRFLKFLNTVWYEGGHNTRKLAKSYCDTNTQKRRYK